MIPNLRNAAPQREAICAMLKTKPASTGDIAKALNITVNMAKHRMMELRQLGKVRYERVRGNHVVWRLGGMAQPVRSGTKREKFESTDFHAMPKLARQWFGFAKC